MIDKAAAQSLLDQAGLNERLAAIAHLRSGGNNEIYRIEGERASYALKYYKASPADTRDRMGAEWDFLTALSGADQEVRVPKAFALDRSNRLGLYELVAGRRLSADEIGAAQIADACGFIVKLNRPKMRDACADLGNASDACFSGRGHLEFIRERIARTAKFSPALAPLAQRLKYAVHDIKTRLAHSGIEMTAELARAEQCLSPSDFGFHNALADANGQLTFLDFEYAGWDDPAKLAADFFFQPEIPVDGRYYPQLLDAALSHIPPEVKRDHIARAVALRPIFGLRWCCIILNPFNPDWAAKHREAISGEALEKLRTARLSAAEETLNKTLALLAGDKQVA